MPFGQHIAVLRRVRRIDAVQRLVGGERIALAAAGLEAGEARLGGRRQAAVPRRDGTGGIAGLVGTERCEVSAEARRVLGADARFRHGRTEQDRAQTQPDSIVTHEAPQNEYLMLAATKSRSLSGL